MAKKKDQKVTPEEAAPVKVEKKESVESPLLKDEKVAEGTPQREQVVVTPEEASFWNRLAWLKLSIEEKAIITENILNEIKGTPLYWTQLILSIVIATFGLLQNSVAVIIGAMVIAPLLQPIKGLSFGITTGQPAYFWRSLAMQAGSILVAILTAYVVSLTVPIRAETAEIVARTAPNLLDLFIAIASGTIAILSLYFKKLAEGAAGVAMAAALLPPLAVVGIELSLGHTSAAGGSFFLFATNLFAILAVGVIIFLFYGFFPFHEDTKLRSIRISLTLFALLIVISFPLFSSLTRIADRINLQTEVSNIIEASLLDVPEAKLDGLQVLEFDEQNVVLLGRVKIPERAQFTEEAQSRLHTALEESLKRKVEMEIEFIPVLRLFPDS